jgi:hypothetical protein
MGLSGASLRNAFGGVIILVSMHYFEYCFSMNFPQVPDLMSIENISLRVEHGKYSK